jgi:hypothetical protein
MLASVGGGGLALRFILLVSELPKSLERGSHPPKLYMKPVLWQCRPLQVQPPLLTLADPLYRKSLSAKTSHTVNPPFPSPIFISLASADSCPSFVPSQFILVLRCSLDICCSERMFSAPWKFSMLLLSVKNIRYACPAEPACPSEPAACVGEASSTWCRRGTAL